MKDEPDASPRCEGPHSVIRADIRAIAIQANEIATELGAAQMANVVLVGALVAATSVVKLEALDAVLEEHVSARHRDKLELNKQALRRGARIVSNQ